METAVVAKLACGRQYNSGYACHQSELKRLNSIEQAKIHDGSLQQAQGLSNAQQRISFFAHSLHARGQHNDTTSPFEKDLCMLAE